MRPFCLAVGGAGGLSVVAKEERACACCDDDDDGIFWELLLYFFPKVVLKEFPYFTPPPPFPKTKELFFKISLSSFSKVSLNPSRIPFFFVSLWKISNWKKKTKSQKSHPLFVSLFGFFLWSLSRHLSQKDEKKGDVLPLLIITLFRLPTSSSLQILIYTLRARLFTSHIADNKTQLLFFLLHSRPILLMASVLSMSASLAGKSNVSSKVFSSSSKKMSSRKVSITTRATGSMVDDKTGIKKMRDGIKEAADENLLTPRFYTTGTSTLLRCSSLLISFHFFVVFVVVVLNGLGAAPGRKISFRMG